MRVRGTCGDFHQTLFPSLLATFVLFLDRSLKPTSFSLMKRIIHYFILFLLTAAIALWLSVAVQTPVLSIEDLVPNNSQVISDFGIARLKQDVWANNAELFEARRRAYLLRNYAPGWKDGLDACPCTQQEAANNPRFKDATHFYTDSYHPGAETEYRTRAEFVVRYSPPSNIQFSNKLMPGQQCAYDAAGKLITHGVGAGTPDAYSPEVTDNFDGLITEDSHTYWDVTPFDAEGMTWQEYQKTWTPNPGKKSNGEACEINPPPDIRNEDKKRGRNFGDPHLFTFDGYRYSFQLVGEFVLAKSDDGLFEVQVRQSPISNSLSVDSAMAMRMPNNYVALYAGELPDGETSTPLRVNSIPTNISRELALNDGSKIYHDGSNYVFKWPTGEEVVAQVNRGGDNPFINITVYVSEAQANRITGLLGNANGDADDDLRFRDGNKLPSRDTYGDLENLLRRSAPVRLPIDSAMNLYLDRLAKDYGADWRVTQSESLFEYAPDQSTQTFTLENFPSEHLALEQLSSTELSEARSICLEREVEPELMEGCTFDVAFSGLSDFARAAARVSQIANLLREFGLDVPDIERVLRDPLPGLPGGIRIPGLPF